MFTLRRTVAFGLGFLVLLSTAEAQKKRVAVMNFDYAAVSTSVTQTLRHRIRMSARESPTCWWISWLPTACIR